MSNRITTSPESRIKPKATLYIEVNSPNFGHHLCQPTQVRHIKNESKRIQCCQNEAIWRQSMADFELEEAGGLQRTLKDLCAGAAGGVAQVLLG